MSLAEMHCTPCRKGEGRLGDEEVSAMMATIPGWSIENGNTLYLHLTFPNFKEAFAFVDRVAVIAEAEQHHPDISFGWGYVDCRLTSHAAGGLTRNDFIVASKIDVLAS